MYWVLFDVAMGVLALLVVGLTGFSLYRHVRRLMSAVSGSSATIGEAGADLNRAQASGAQRA